MTVENKEQQISAQNIKHQLEKILFKPLDYMQVYFRISDKFLDVCDQNSNQLLIISDISFTSDKLRDSFSLNQQLYMQQYKFNSRSIQSQQLTHQIILHENISYCIYFGHIFKISNIQIQCVACLSHLNDNYYLNQNPLTAFHTGSVFKLQNTVFFHNDNNMLFTMNNQNELIKYKNKFEATRFMQFCDKVYGLSQNSLFICKEINKRIIIKQEIKFENLLFQGCGVAVILCELRYQQITAVLNMLDGVVSYVDDPVVVKMYIEQIYMILEHGRNGRQVQNKIVIELFGENTAKRIVEYQKLYNNSQNVLQYKKCMFNNLHLLLKVQFEQAKNNFDRCRQTIIINTQKPQAQINRLIETQNFILAAFNSSFTEATQ
ncbi:Hypothetical_protein [Hexamita inflata]|uniref:Hypothetical_protein n=1 Tax=Hexamita inflata TaxID=28002 RepID=A0AA86NPI9_9EUKA|nr:Hypothetical protein HINF_LOCUS10897 [Hexamita inflata]